MNLEILEGISRNNKDTLKEQFALDVLTGFSADEKYLSSKYFYDDIGSELFAKITETDDYYPTRCEFDVLQRNKKEIAKKLGNEKINIIELGAGDGRKTKVLLEEFLSLGLDVNYVPVDISIGALEQLDKRMSKELPDLKTQYVAGEYMEAINWAGKNLEGKKLVLFLGSNIGNFNKAQSKVYLRVLWKNLNDKDLVFTGFDLKKDINKMLWAYNDREGITAEFNINILRRMNKELGADFKLDQFQHFGTYNPKIGAMESYLISKVDQEVYIKELEKSFHFKAFEPIHMEYSYKYQERDISYLAENTGHEIIENFYDSDRNFVDSLWKVVKE